MKNDGRIEAVIAVALFAFVFLLTIVCLQRQNEEWHHGYDAGYAAGYEEAYDEWYREGFAAGWEEGYADCMYDYDVD